MASELLFHEGPPGEYAPGFPRVNVDARELEHAARIRGLTTEEYTAEALALRYSDGKPMFRVAPKASEDVREVAAEVKAEEQTPKPKVALGTRAAGG